MDALLRIFLTLVSCPDLLFLRGRTDSFGVDCDSAARLFVFTPLDDTVHAAFPAFGFGAGLVSCGFGFGAGLVSCGFGGVDLRACLPVCG